MTDIRKSDAQLDAEAAALEDREPCIECEWSVGHDPRCGTGRLLLDVDRLARAMSGLEEVNWPKRWEPEDFEWVARQIAAQYAASPPSKKGR